MRNILAVFLALSMIFNVTSELFAQIISDSNQVKSYFEQTDKYKQTANSLTKELEAEREKQELLKMFGLNFEDYKKDFQAYAKANKINYDNATLQASWDAQIKTFQEYNNDYLSLIKIFDKKTYQEVHSDSNYFLNKKEDKVKYDGKTYNKVALLHAALHNLITRKTNGYTGKGAFVFSQEKAEDFSLDEKVSVMGVIYSIVVKNGYYPKDEQSLYNFSYQIVLNGKKYFDNDIYKADLPNFIMPPAFVNAEDRQKRDHGKDDRKKQAISAGKAIYLLTALAKTSAQKQQSAQAIYDLARKTMRGDYGAISISGGADSLVALGTEDSLSKLYTLLTEDLYRGLATRVSLFALESLSVEEWVDRSSGISNRVKNGLGQYHNAIARRHLYIDDKKNSSDIKYMAQNNVKEGLYSVIYRDIFEDIGNTIGEYSNNPKVAAVANKLVLKYLDDTAKKIREGEKKLHTSLVVGILGTTKYKTDNLTKAAKIIYNGSWWDINEATQRDKNNIAAKYLNAQKKPYNEQKRQDFKKISSAKTVGNFIDIGLNAIFITSLIVSMPSIIRGISSIAKRTIGKIKVSSVTKAVEAKPVVKPAEIKPTSVKPVETKPSAPKPTEAKPAEIKPTNETADLSAPKEIKTGTEKVVIDAEQITPKQTEYTASVGEGGGGAMEVKPTVSESLKYSKQQYLSDLASEVKAADAAELFEVENAAKAGTVTPFKKGLIVNKPWAELAPWRKTLATGLINLEFNTEIFLSSLRVFKPKYAGFTLPLPLTLTGEAFLKPLTLVTQTTETAKNVLTTADVFKASQAVREASPVVKVAVGSQAPLKTTNLLDMFQQFSAGKGLLMGGFGIEGVLNEFHGGASSGNSGLSNLEKENLARAAKKPADKVRRTKQEQKKQANVYRDFIATQENLSKEAKEVIQEAYKKHVKGDIKGAISLYDKAIAKMPIVSVYYFGRALLKEYYLREHSGAIEDLKHAVKLSPNILTYQIVLDDILDKLQNEGQAFITPLDNTEEINNLKQEMKGLKKNLFSKKSENKLYLAILPITMSVVMQAVNASVDLVNKIPAIKKAFNKAETKTLELMEKYNFSSQESMEVFSDIFEKELVSANVPLERVQELLQEANSYMKGEHSVRLAKEKAQEDPQDQFEEVNKNTTSNYDEALAVFADDLRLFYDSQDEAWKYGYQAREVKETLQEAQPYALGVMYFEKKQYKEAISQFDKAIEENPVKSAYKMRGQAKYYLGDYEGALKDFNKAISIGYNTAMDYFESGSLKEMLGDYKGAIADYNKAKELNDYNSDMYGVYDSIYSDAIESATKKMNSPAEKPQTLTEPPAAPSAPKPQTTLTASELFERAESKYDAEDYLSALEDLNQAISLDSDKATYYLLRAQTKEALKDYRGAVADYEECAKVDPVNAPLYFAYRAYAGERFADIQQEQKLKQFWQKLKEKLFGKENSNKLFMALPFVPKAVMQLLTNDVTLEQLSNRREVIETAFYKAQKRVPQEIVNTNAKEAANQFVYHFRRELEAAGVAQEKTDKLVSKVKEYIKEDTAPQKDKSNVEEVKEQQVSAAVNENKTSEKQKRLSLWAKLKAKKKAENYYKEAISAKEKGDKKTALAYYDQALEYAPNNAQYLYERGRVKLDLSGDYKGAFEDFSKALLFDNTNGTYFYMRALVGYSFMEDKSIPIKDLAFSIKYTDPKESIYIVRNNLFTTWTKGQTYKEYLKDNPSLETQNTQTPQKKTFGQIMSGLKGKIFGPKSFGGKLYMSIIPLPPEMLVQFLTGQLTPEQLNNRTSAIEEAFANAEEKTIKNFHDINSPETIAFFLFNLQKELSSANVDQKKAQKLIQISRAYMRQQLPEEVRKTEALMQANRAAVMIVKGEEPQRIVEAYDQAIEWDQTNSYYYFNRGFFGVDLNPKKAKEDLEKAIALDPDNDTYKQFFALFIEAYKDDLGLKKSIKAIFKELMGKLSAILADIKNYAQDKPANSFSKESKITQAQEYAQKAYEKRLKGYYATSVAYYNNAISLDPSKADYYYERALAKHLDIGDYEGAMEDYISAMDLDPENADFYTEQASKAISVKELREEEAQKYEQSMNFNLQNGNIEGAVQAIDKAIEINPFNAEYYFYRSNIKYYLEDNKGSFLDIKKALDINPNEAKYYMAMASVRMSFEDFRGTLADIDRAIELDKNNDVYYISRASIRTLFRDFEGVFEDYNQAIKLNPTNPDYYVMRANLKYSFEDYEGCLRDYNKAVKLAPENPEYYILRAPIRYGFGDYKGSMADYDKAIELDPEESIYYQLRGIAKGMRNDFEGAIEDYDIAISLDPENPEFYCARALAKADIEGNEESALADFDTAIELDSKNPDYYHQRGMTYEDLGDYDNALADYNKAIELDSEEVYYYFSRAMLNKEYDNYADALVDFDKVISLAPNYAEAYYQRGLIREKSLYVTGAFEDFNIAHNLDPENEEYYKMLIKYYN